MAKRLLVAFVVTLAGMPAAIPRAASPQAAAAPQASAHQFVLKMEMQKLPDAPVPAAGDPVAMMGDMFRQAMLPDGMAEMAVITDGQSVRAELRGRMMMLSKGTVMLSIAAQGASYYVLNPADKTYYVLKPDAMKLPVPPSGIAMPKPDVSVKPSGTFETIAGYRAEKVDVSWRMPIPVPEGVEIPADMPTDIKLTVEMWCAPDLKMPANATMSMNAVAKLMPGMGFDAVANACSFPMRSRLQTSMMPGYAFVTQVTQATDQPPAPDAFRIPSGYKEVPVPTPKMPGVGGF